MKNIFIFLLIIGAIIILLEIGQAMKYCPPQKVVYRYIPRTLKEEMEEPAYPSDIFNAMFTQPSTWIGEVNDLDTRKKEAINQFFASQL